MALVVFLKGVNVGGHRRFRPRELAQALTRLDVVSIGAAGTFVVRQRVSRAKLHAEIARHLPFDPAVLICDGRDILRLADTDPFAGVRPARDVIQFASVLARRGTPSSAIPFSIPPRGPWCVRVLACRGRFVLGLHRREMKAIGYLGQLEKVFGTSVTTRSWTTMRAVVRVLESQG